MTLITIPLVLGQNYISFPASSTYNFRKIFTDSGVMDNIATDTLENKMLYRYDPIFKNDWVLIDIDLGFIEKGEGYYLYVTSVPPGVITYDGVEYVITFDQFKSRILRGWNILGVGKDPIVVQTWCKILDPMTMTPVTILEPKHSYLVNYDECIQPGTPSIGSASMGAIVAIGAILGTYYLLREFSIIGKPLETTSPKVDKISAVV